MSRRADLVEEGIDYKTWTGVSTTSSSASRYQLESRSGGVGAPYFVIEPKSTFVTSGESVNFTAQCEGDPLPKVHWTLNGVKILDDGGKYAVGAIRGKRTLDIRNCTVGDSGTYTCVAENNKGQTVSSFTLDVMPRAASKTLQSASTYESYRSSSSRRTHSKQGPYILGKLRPEVRLDGTIRLECSLADNTNLDKVVWLKDGIPLRDADPKFSQASRGNSYVLQIRSAASTDAGRYECQFTDKQGVQSSTAHTLSEATCGKVEKKFGAL
jgi:hypothetical protein